MAKIRGGVAGLPLLAFAASVNCQTLPATPIVTVPVTEPDGQGIRPRAQSLDLGVVSRVLYTDNLLLSPDSSKQNGFLLEASPYIKGSYYSGRAQGELYYQLRNFYRTAGDDRFTGGRHFLAASGTAALAGEWLYITGSAAMYNTNAVAYGTLTFDPSTNLSTNVASIRTATVSPYIIGRFSSLADYRLQYTATVTDTDAPSYLLPRNDQRLFGSLQSPLTQRAWGWFATAEDQRREFYNGITLGRTSSTVGANVLVTPELRLGAGVAYSRIEGLRDESGRSSGFGPLATLDWAPTARTSLKMTASRQYFGSAQTLAFSHRQERFVAAATYNRGVVTSIDGTALVYNPTALFATDPANLAANPVVVNLSSQGLISSLGLSANTGLISGAIVRDRTFIGTAGYLLPTGGVALTYLRSARETLYDVTDPNGALTPGASAFLGSRLSQLLSLGWDYRLTTSSKLNLTLRSLRVSDENTPTSTTLKGAVGSYETKLTANASLITGASWTGQRSAGAATGDYTARVLFVALDMRF